MWSLTKAPSLRAQLTPCPKFNASTEYICNDCCTANPPSMFWTDGTSEGAGTQTLQQMYSNCGSATNSCLGGGTQSTDCGSQPWDQAVDDSTCCSPAGVACDAGACCDSLTCLSTGICGACYSNGSACGANSDCCYGSCNNGICSSQACEPDDGPCFDGTDCCSGICDPDEFTCDPL